MYDDEQTQSASVEWAKTFRLFLFSGLVLLGFLFAYFIGGREWMKWYAIVFIPIAGVFGGIYAIMSLMSERDQGMARAFGDILHAHSQSGAQQAKMVTEVIRGANAINKADADVQAAMLKQFASIGGHYEKQLAKMQGRLIAAESQSFQVVEEEPAAKYLLPYDDNESVTYELPDID